MSSATRTSPVTRLVRVAGDSMAPTYRSSDLLLTRPAGRAGARVRRGDVVVFRHGELRMIKRVVGMPGDLVELEAGRLFVNGDPVGGRPRVPGAFTQTWRVPGSGCFMAGDNAAASDDSRVWDEPFVRVESVDAVVTRRLWGSRRTGRLSPRRRDAGAGRVA
jgi:signal peptidase I